jgi:uncharacterized protein YyaL (SSP411 family)
MPNKVVVFRPIHRGGTDIVRIAPYAEHYSSLDGRATAYVCLNYACELPTTSTARMLELLGSEE